MNEEKYNWPRFYKLLGEKGPDLLTGVEKNVIDTFIRDQAKSTDEFLSYDIEEALIKRELLMPWKPGKKVSFRIILILAPV